MGGGDGKIRSLEPARPPETEGIVRTLREAVEIAETENAVALALVMVHADGSVTTSFDEGDRAFSLLGGVSWVEHRIREVICDGD